MYEVENPIGKAMSGMGQAAGTYGGMMKDIPANQDPGPSAGGAAMAGLGAGAAGAQIGTMVSSAAAAGPIGLGVGALIGIGSYLFS